MNKCRICGIALEDKQNYICEVCKNVNEQKKNYHVDLTNRTALITGARTNIGYATALRMLRDGAKVIAITRFPYNALNRYSKEKDFEIFKDRLLIYQFDLKYVNKLDSLIEFLYTNLNSLDILINNAAQTIRKSKQFYLSLNENEQHLKQLYGKNNLCIETQFNFLEELDYNLPSILFNNELLEENDLHNSWVARADEVSIQEFLEVQLINVTAPFILTSRLKELLKKSNRLNKFIINVSSTEGKFNVRRKNSYHTHTNMAKASLNMMTYSLNMEYIKDRIFIYSVDPGWISNLFPKSYPISITPPLNYEDGAVRICDPIYKNLNEQRVKDSGNLYKNFKIVQY